MNTISDLNKLAKEIVEKNQYMTLGTNGTGLSAWVSPLVYTYDKDFNFYFISLPNSKHVKNLRQNSQISFTIFDSHQLFGEGVGLQIEGEVEELPYTKSLKAVSFYFKRKWPYGKPSAESVFKQLIKNKTYHFYKIKPTQVWMNDPNQQVDIRIEVKLK